MRASIGIALVVPDVGARPVGATAAAYQSAAINCAHGLAPPFHCGSRRLAVPFFHRAPAAGAPPGKSWLRRSILRLTASYHERCSPIPSASDRQASPDLSNGHEYSLRVRLAGGSGDHSVVVEDKVAATPDCKAHAQPEPQRVGGVVLADPIDAGLAADVVESVRRDPEGGSEVAARVPLENEQRVLAEARGAAHATIGIGREHSG